MPRRVGRLRSLCNLVRTLRLARRLIRDQRARPRDDRWSFILTCATTGELNVRSYASYGEFKMAYDDFTEDDHRDLWIIAYDHLKDRRG